MASHELSIRGSHDPALHTMQMRVRLHLPTGLVPSINPATISAADSGIAISIRDLATYNPPPMTMDNVSNYRGGGGWEGGRD